MELDGRLFQVYEIEGKSTATKEGFFLMLEADKKLIFDGDFAGFEAADAKYKQLVAEAIEEGFHPKLKTGERVG